MLLLISTLAQSLLALLTWTLALSEHFEATNASLMTTNTSQDEVEPADIEPQPASTSDEAHKRSRTPYSIEKKKSQEKARLTQENGIVMGPPCTYCQKKMEKNPKPNHQCMRDEGISMLRQLCVVQKNVCSANPYKGQRVQGCKGGGWVKVDGGRAAAPEQRDEETEDEASEQDVETPQEAGCSSQFKLTLEAFQVLQLR